VFIPDDVFTRKFLPIELRGFEEQSYLWGSEGAEGLAGLKCSFPEWRNSSTTAGNDSGMGEIFLRASRLTADYMTCSSGYGYSYV
jgi:hypothetical protein